MEARQNSADAQQPTMVTAKNDEPFVLSLQQQAWVDYNALSGLVSDLLETQHVDKTGAAMTLRKMPITEFATLVGVNRDTLRNWRTSIPNFWALVNQRRKELNPTARLAKMHEVWFLSALKPGAEGFRDRQMWLANFDNDFHMPTQPVEHGLANNWAALLQAQRRKAENIQEGEVVNGPNPAV